MTKRAQDPSHSRAMQFPRIRLESLFGMRMAPLLGESISRTWWKSACDGGERAVDSESSFAPQKGRAVTREGLAGSVLRKSVSSQELVPSLPEGCRKGIAPDRKMPRPPPSAPGRKFPSPYLKLQSCQETGREE